MIYSLSDFSITEMKWDRPNLTHKFIFLDKIPKIFSLFMQLRKDSPDIIITSGFNLTMLTGYIYARLYKKKHVVFTDSWLQPVILLSYLHHLIRKIVIRRSNGYICVGKKGKGIFAILWCRYK